MEWRLAIFNEDDGPVELHSLAAARLAVRSGRLGADSQVVIYNQADDREMRQARDWPQLAPLFAADPQPTEVPATGAAIAPAGRDGDEGSQAILDTGAQVPEVVKSDGEPPGPGQEDLADLDGGLPVPLVLAQPEAGVSETPRHPVSVIWSLFAVCATVVMAGIAVWWLLSAAEHKMREDAGGPEATRLPEAACGQDLPPRERLRCKLPQFAMDDDRLSAAYTKAVARGVTVGPLLNAASLDEWRSRAFSHCGQQYEGCLDWRYKKLADDLAKAADR